MSDSRIWQVVLFLIISFSRVFSADNVCSRLENYTVTSMETYTEPVVVNTFTWCLQIPPRCPKTRTEMRQRYRLKKLETVEPARTVTYLVELLLVKSYDKVHTRVAQPFRTISRLLFLAVWRTELKTRIVNECCDGYKTISSNEETSPAGVKCVPLCEKCSSGICVSPNQCQCVPGSQDKNCQNTCPPGTWGFKCEEKCNCAGDVACNPIDGHCVCPPGLHGQICNKPCPSDRWGPGCAFPCDCKDPIGECHPETGRCIHDDLDNTVPVQNTSYSRNEENSVTVNFTIIQLGRESSRIWETTETSTAEETRGKQTCAIYVIIVVSFDELLEDVRETPVTLDNPDVRTTSPETSSVSTSDEKKIRTQAHEDGNSSTAKPVIVWVSVPERRRNLDKDRGKFAMKNPYVGHVDDNANLHDIGPPKTDYVKNIHKDIQPAPISLDIALIVVASIVSLGLTSVAVAMVLHMRSKLLEAARISIYEEGKTKNQESTNTTKISSIVAGTLPQTPIRLVPLFASTPEPRVMPSMTNNDLTSNYANGAATIGLRISGNLHGLFQEDHYDRPPATRIHLQNDFDLNTEHVYDEIPLQSSPLNSRKNA
ncbi:Platelet endothelial aggregation receptor 1 [Melipona quadrifasciata]|uniref:Platelet endothelial aggregation receptor 1 n=1 Tax=Melipona quadrifasciata TaxID=166423 RepID=A0A0N0BK89_9HYME|nr:Platelet endothelial aggregation receptor 1 [Melipona quadrifasciata]